MRPEKHRPPLPWALIILFMVISAALLAGGLKYSSTSRELSGAGLGLTISKACSDLPGCEITLNSAKGKSSEFLLMHPP